MNVIAIIPARGGSKRIPMKNIRDFKGKPVIHYSIRSAISSNIFDKIIVSTDSDKIANISKKLGADIPFIRSKKNSDDFATTDDVIKEVLDFYSQKNEEFDYACCIYPVNPLIKSSNIIKGFEKIKKNNFDCVFSAVKYSYPIQRSFRIDSKDRIKMIEPNSYKTRSQDLKETFHDAGQFYWFKPKIFMENLRLWTNNTSVIKLNELEVHDIDNETDWKIAEIKFKIQKN